MFSAYSSLSDFGIPQKTIIIDRTCQNPVSPVHYVEHWLPNSNLFLMITSRINQFSQCQIARAEATSESWMMADSANFACDVVSCFCVVVIIIELILRDNYK